MKYKIVLDKGVVKTLDHMQAEMRKRILSKLDGLCENPRGSGAEKLTGTSVALYRVRVGDWRIVYAIQDCELVVIIVRVAHRREVYR